MFNISRIKKKKKKSRNKLKKHSTLVFIPLSVRHNVSWFYFVRENTKSPVDHLYLTYLNTWMISVGEKWSKFADQDIPIFSVTQAEEPGLMLSIQANQLSEQVTANITDVPLPEYLSTQEIFLQAFLLCKIKIIKFSETLLYAHSLTGLMREH